VRFAAPAALVGVAIVWGWAFLAVADAIALYPMYAFLAWRFALAAVAFVAFYPRVLKRIDRRSLKRGLLAGLVLAVSYILQTWGLDGATKTTPAKAAFITGLYVVITPLLQAAWLRRRPQRATIVGGLIALVGLWVLSGIGTETGGWVFGDTLVALCAITFSVHIIVLGSTKAHHDTGVLTLVQLATVAVVCAVISGIKERVGPPTDLSVIGAIVLCGVLASALAFAIQTWAQKRMPPSRVALILVSETAWGGVFGWSAAGVWPVREVFGAALMFVGLIISEALAAFGTPAEDVILEPAVEGMPAPVIDSGHTPLISTEES